MALETIGYPDLQESRRTHTFSILECTSTYCAEQVSSLDLQYFDRSRWDREVVETYAVHLMEFLQFDSTLQRAQQ
jgi:hypothetical protein